ncbi:Protein kinase domain-containing protein [Thermoactinomyces sp. DSM 45891]|uniref:hypothetical protein n=1 Tax=Thermoactinomyces sp. DSM 45891 TaxID=1761907 RepID=UPI0009151E57|nr:hypothetical protein [Thermoactinomyces sp. DSM 45891]SFX27794.1 Protein kinase domain-containing protein [Thermoactinomyces sp. DSM 45891]
MRERFADQEAIHYVRNLVSHNKLDHQLPLLGEGLSGKVYSLEDYAIKVYKDDYSEKDDSYMLHHLQDHSAFPTLHHHEDKFMIVDRIQGNTLADSIKAGEKLSENQFAQIEDIVTDLYDHGIVAQDLHLNNMMIDHDSNIKVIDVGRFFHTDYPELYQDILEDHLNLTQYHMGFFSSIKDKLKKKKYYGSSSHRRYRKHSSSDYRRHRHHSSSSSHRKRHYYGSSSSHHRRHKRKGFFSF